MRHECFLFKRFTDPDEPENNELKLLCRLLGTRTECKQLVKLLNDMNPYATSVFEIDLEVEDGEGIYDQL
jgi:hypothetical protein